MTGAQWVVAGFCAFCGIGNAVIQFGINERINKLEALLKRRDVI